MSTEHVLACIRKKLNEEKIQLWLSPYTTLGNDVGHYSQEMLDRFSRDLQFSEDVIREHLEKLRLNALEKLAAREKFESTGIAVLKLKVLGKPGECIPSVINLDVSLNITGEDLCHCVASRVGISPQSLKLITQGKIVKSQATLKEQNIKSNSTVMVMLQTAGNHNQDDKRLHELNQAKHDAELLTNTDSGHRSHNYDLQIADQNGQVLDLPDQERKSLAVAMTLHEKSRTAMKHKKYETALPILLEADSEFKQCASKILDLVDNYALLNLDIVWCYLCLKSINFLPDAERRLKICQSCFDRSYGQNLERLQALKGDKTKERALFARLHLLQGIVAYHNGDKESARAFFREVKQDIQFLKVDDEKLSHVMAMGYSSIEARLALRTSGGSIAGAVNSIIARREEKAIIKKHNEEERKRKSEKQKLGKTLNGQWLNPDFHRSLINMGFPFAEAQQALQHSNNNISLAVQILHDQQYLLKPDLDEAAIAKIVSLGFETSSAGDALENSGGNVEDALANLFSGKSTRSKQSGEGSSHANEEAARDAISRLAEEIPEDEEDHLDLNMNEEESFLFEYLALLDSLPQETNH